MADDANPSSPFDVQTIKQLVALMSRHELSEIDLSEVRAGSVCGAARVRC